MSDEIIERITDSLFTRTALIVFADTGKDIEKRIAAIMSMSARKLAEGVVEDLGLRHHTKHHYVSPGIDTPKQRWATPWEDYEGEVGAVGTPRRKSS